MAFRSDEYAWVDVNVVMQGRVVAGLRAVTYTETQEKTNIYAKGNKPYARTRGNKEYEGSIGILQSELEALQRGAGDGKSINDIRPFDITIAYANEDGGDVVTDILKGVEFTEVSKSLSQNDPFMEIELPIIIGDIKYNQ
jgi:hypothetical protein